MNYARRQQYRRLSHAVGAGAASVAAGLLALAIAAAGAISLAGIVVVVAVGFGLYARHWFQLADRSRVGARSEDAVRHQLASTRGRPARAQGKRVPRLTSVVRPRPDHLARYALGALLYFPSRKILETPASAALDFDELELATDDGERLHGWCIAGREPSLGHLLFCHGNAGNIGDRVPHAALLAAAGFDVLLFDYRGYGRSTGRPDEQGTYRDARTALAALLRRPGVGRERVFYLGESLGGAVALALAVERPPRGLILQSTFTSIRDAARAHYPFIPTALIPDAYPSLRLISRLTVPLLVLHGDRDEIVPLAHGQALLAAAGEPKRIRVFAGLGHNDLVSQAGQQYAAEIADWAASLDS